MGVAVPQGTEQAGLFLGCTVGTGACDGLINICCAFTGDMEHLCITPSGSAVADLPLLLQGH